MLDPHGFVATCNSTHFFVVKGTAEEPEVWTSDGRFCLGGITRGNVLRMCREGGITARETTFSLTDEVDIGDCHIGGVDECLEDSLEMAGHPIDAGGVESLLVLSPGNAADKALYASKQAGRNRVTVKLFSPRVRILVADGSGKLARAIDGKLKQYFALLQARSGQDTLALARRNRPDVIVLDDQLSGDDAITTIKRLREDSNTGQIPLLVTCDNIERWHSLGLEVDGCYPDQDPPQELLDKLNRMLF